MELIIKKQIGSRSYNFVVQGADLHEVVMAGEKLSFPDVPKCGLCESDWLRLTAYTTKEEGYKYVKILCGKCKGSLTFGQVKKDPSTFYMRRDDDGKLEWKKHEEKAG